MRSQSKGRRQAGREPNGRVELSAADREIRLGIWKIHVLFHAAKREVWGIWLLEELAEHGHVLSPGTLYPALARMERNGWLERSGTANHARARRTFRITPAGRRLLEALRTDVTELYAEVVLGREPARARGETPRRAGSPTRVRRNGSTARFRKARRRS